MKPSSAFHAHRDAIQLLLGRYRVRSTRVFGSVARGTDTDASDLDLLVETMPGATLFDLGGLQEELELLLRVKVDVRTLNDFPPAMRGSVLREAQPA
jgi:uncharacterized protein